MDSPSSGPTRKQLEVRGARASSVIVQRIPAGAKDIFLQWERDISAVAAQFPGYQTTEIYPPSGQQEEWVVAVHFDDPKTLQDWLDSPTRAEWIAKLPAEIQDFRLKTVPSGFGAWFAGLTEADAPLPHWKMALTILFGLYPTVMLYTMFVSPYMKDYPLAIAMLVGNVASVCFLEWLGTPFIVTPLLGRWLRANKKEQQRFSLVGGAVILVALAVMVVLFRLITS